MNIIRMRQIERQGHIKTICDSVETALLKGKTVVFDDVVMAAMANIGLSRRTARDYVKVAFFRLGIGDGQKKLTANAKINPK